MTLARRCRSADRRWCVANSWGGTEDQAVTNAERAIRPRRSSYDPARMPDLHFNHICPQFSRTDTTSAGATVDTSTRYICRKTTLRMKASCSFTSAGSPREVGDRFFLSTAHDPRILHVEPDSICGQLIGRSGENVGHEGVAGLHVTLKQYWTKTAVNSTPSRCSRENRNHRL